MYPFCIRRGFGVLLLCFGWLLGQVFLPHAQNANAQPEHGAALFEEHFDGGNGGWSVQGDAQGNSAQPTYRAAGGNPGGYIEARDNAAGGVWYWSAPASFNNALRQAWRSRGQHSLMLTFDLRQSDISSPFDTDDLLLKGAGHTLAFDTTPAPATSWTSYAVPLTAARWHNKTAKRAATEADLEAAMAALESLWIRGEYRDGADTGGLDNVGWRWQSERNNKRSASPVTLRFMRRTVTGFEPINELSYEQPFYVEVLFTTAPTERQRKVALQWPGGKREFVVSKVAGSPLVFRSKPLRLAR